MARMAKQDEFLRQVAAAGIAERLCEMQGRDFRRVLVYGGGELAFAPNGCEMLLRADRYPWLKPDCVADEEYLPLQGDGFDLIISFMHLHEVNMVQGVLAQYKQALKPEGLLLGCMLGGDSMLELRHALLHAATKLGVGSAPRIAPMIDIKTLGMLLAHAGFSLPVVDSEVIAAEYSSLQEMLRDVQRISGGNALLERHNSSLTRQLIAAAESWYMHEYRGLALKYELLYFMGMRLNT